MKIKKKTGEESLNNYLVKNKNIIFIIILILLPILIYFNSLSNDYVYCDDSDIILRDSSRLASISNIPSEFEKGYMTTDYYRPLVMASFVLDYSIGGSDPLVYHITNLILHIACSVCLYILLGLLGFDRILAFAGAALFASHPLLTNAVAWIAGRNDMMMALFSMLTMIFFIKFLNNQKNIILIFSVFFCLLAILSKETALLLPVFPALIIYIRSAKNSASQYRHVLFFLIPPGIWFILRSNATLGEPVYESGFTEVLSNLRVLPEFVSKFVFPIDLSVLPVYSFSITITGIIFIVILAFLTIKFKPGKTLLFGIAVFLLFVLPGTYITLLNAHEWNEYLECRAYLATAGLIIIMLAMIVKFDYKRHIKIYAYIWIIILLIFSVLSFSFSAEYKNAENFYSSAVDDFPDRAMYHYILYKVMLEKKDNDQAERQISAAVRLSPYNYKFQYDAGHFFFGSGDYYASLNHLKKALELKSDHKYAMIGLVYAYFALGKPDSSLILLKKLKKLWPDDKTIDDRIDELYRTLEEKN